MLPPSNNKRENDVQTAEPEDDIQAQVFASAAASSASLGMSTITSLCSYIQDAVKGRSSNADDLPFLGEYCAHTHTHVPYPHRHKQFGSLADKRAL